jgi:hypothetical protein
MIRKIRLVAVVVAVLALAAVPPTASAKHGGSHGKSCAAKSKAFVVKGTLVSFTADDATTPANDASVTLTVTGANRHARKSGELVDEDAGTVGTQVTYTAASDPFAVKLSGYDGAADTPSAGDKVRVKGKIAYTKKRCAPDGTSVEDRYGEPNVKRVKLVDKD